MIDEARTLELFGRGSGALTRESCQVVMVCEECGTARVIRGYGKLAKLCQSCAKSHITDETKQKISNTMKGRLVSEDTKQKMSTAQKGRIISEETRRLISNGQRGRIVSEETRQKLSATRRGIEYDEWESYAKESPYCPKFNEACKESNRVKYGRRCFLTGLPEVENLTKTGKPRKLSVHHVDMNKQQGCDGNRWRLVPLCIGWHGRTHNDLWEARIAYLLENND